MVNYAWYVWFTESRWRERRLQWTHFVVIRRVATVFIQSDLKHLVRPHKKACKNKRVEGVLHMCCRFPRSQGGAHSTGTGPAHGPAVCSLPAAGSTQHRVYMQPKFYPIYAEHCHQNSLFYTQIEHTVSSQWKVNWDTDHVGLFGGFGHSIASLTVISGGGRVTTRCNECPVLL